MNACDILSQSTALQLRLRRLQLRGLMGMKLLEASYAAVFHYLHFEFRIPKLVSAYQKTAELKY